MNSYQQTVDISLPGRACTFFGVPRGREGGRESTWSLPATFQPPPLQPTRAQSSVPDPAHSGTRKGTTKASEPAPRNARPDDRRRENGSFPRLSAPGACSSMSALAFLFPLTSLKFAGPVCLFLSLARHGREWDVLVCCHEAQGT